MTKILDIVKPGAVTGENLQKLFAFARENGFAFPSVNCVGTDSINAVIEAGAKAKSPVMVQFSTVVLHSSLARVSKLTVHRAQLF